MRELVVHIKTLLLTNDCVIVPDFGGFIAFDVPARWKEEEHFFTPPMRTVGFNPQLKLNDGLVVQAYMSAYGTTFPDASKRVSKAARALKQHLMNEGLIELAGLGTLRVAMDGRYHFLPFVDGLDSPLLYGLGELHIKPVGLTASTALPSSRAIEPVEEVEEEAVAATTENDADYSGYPEERTPSFRRTFVRVTVASAAAVALFFLLSTPVRNAGSAVYQARIVSSHLFEHTAPVPAKAQLSAEKPVQVAAPKAVTPEASNVEAPKPVAEVKAAPAVVAPVAAPIAKVQSSSDKYYIVVSALAQRDNAVDMVNTLKKNGYSKACMITNTRFHMICIASYANEEEAVNASRKFREGKYEDAWVFKKKTEK